MKDYRNEREVEPFMALPLERREQRPAPWHKDDVLVTLACAIGIVALIAIIAIWG